MTRYTVVWMEDALNDLAEIWLRSIEREQVSESSQAIDQQLHFDPQDQGVDKGDGIRYLAVPPLVAIFKVRADDRIVEVARIQTI